MKIGIIMGSDSDWPVMQKAVAILDEFKVDYDVVVASAHRTPEAVRPFVKSVEETGGVAFIAGAGAAAHLAGVVASLTTLPVIGIPLNATGLNGIDSLLSTVQMPSGLPVATMAIDGAKNAALFCVQICALQDNKIADDYRQYRLDMKKQVQAKNAKIQELLKRK